ncbi:ATP-binding cassette domain-containing protein [Myceligenerans xiligouense]|uniref:ATP-binding cassette domain-containing protein n=1 Tax=Myceligenerans xiligouense TaxID=253184 RepID=UPI0014777B21|nr:ABC transporter ATP-binding protein [Myceligenerans xiligouense]
MNRADHPQTPAVAVETLGLRKTYTGVRGRTVAVDGLDLLVPARGVHVLLGPAKAGKSTVLRLLLGLARADAGAARLLGVAVPDVGRQLTGRVGAVVGEPGFLDRLTGRRNLLMHPAATSKDQVDVALRQAGLADVALDVVGSYAPGARRRLALAAALLPGPDLLIVDDPTRGLDPTGARELRTLLRKIAGRGPAVLMTTDALVEAQQLADTVTVLAGGRVVGDGPAVEVIGDLATAVRLRVDDGDRAVAELTAARFRARRDGDAVVVDGVAEPAEVTKALARKKLYVTEMSTRRESLESLVRRLAPEPEPQIAQPSRAEQRAARKEAERKAARKKEAVEQKRAEKEAVERKRAGEETAERNAAGKDAAEPMRTGKDTAERKQVGKGAAERKRAGTDTTTERKAAQESAQASEAGNAPERAARKDERAARRQERAARKQQARDERELAKLLEEEEREAAEQARRAAKQARREERELAKLIAAEKKQEKATTKKTTNTEPESEPKAKLEPEPEPKSEPKPKSEPESKPKPKPRPEREPQPAAPSDAAHQTGEQPSRRQQRRAAFDAKVAEKQAAYDARVVAREQAAAEKQAARLARAEKKRAKENERELREHVRAEDEQGSRKRSRTGTVAALLGERAAETVGGAAVNRDPDEPALETSRNGTSKNGTSKNHASEEKP